MYLKHTYNNISLKADNVLIMRNGCHGNLVGVSQ